MLLEILGSHHRLLSRGGGWGWEGKQEWEFWDMSLNLGCWMDGVRGGRGPESGRLHRAGASEAPLWEESFRDEKTEI